MTSAPSHGAASRVRAFWRRTLLGPSPAARMEIYDELAPSLKAGIGVREALRVTAARHGGRKGAAAAILSDAAERSEPLSAAMAAHPESFSVLEAALAVSGEKTGRLDAAFREMSAQLDRRRATRNRLLQACAYPFLLVHCLIVIPSAGFLIPSRGVGGWLAFALTGIALLWLALVAATTAVVALSARPGFVRATGAVPLLGRAARSLSLALFARTLATLHGAGVPHDEALRVAAAASSNSLLAEDSERAVAALAGGATMSEALRRMPSLPPEDLGILVSGEESGELEASARRVAELEEERFDVVTRRVAALLPVLLVLLVGAIVAALAFKVVGDYFGAIDRVLR